MKKVKVTGTGLERIEEHRKVAERFFLLVNRGEQSRSRMTLIFGPYLQLNVAVVATVLSVRMFHIA